MAQGYLAALCENRMHVAVYNLGSCQPDQLAVVAQISQEDHIDVLAHADSTAEEIADLQMDLVIHLSPMSQPKDQPLQAATRETPSALFIGMPVHLYWGIAETQFHPSENIQSSNTLPAIRDQVRSKVASLIELAFLDALLRQRSHRDLLLDAMDEGIIVHDQHRHIYLFNRAAEELTGYKKNEVLGKDCYEVFAPNGLCGSQCKLTEHREDPQSSKKHQYEVMFTDKHGQDHRLRVSSGSMELHPGGQRGLVAAFRDITEVSQLRKQMKEKYSFHGMVGQSAAMREIFKTIQQIVTSEYPVLITGESGTGKELVARAIHNESRRQGGPFVPINCGALPENILESELFGHVRGAFTGAIRDKKGRFELAHHGTLFLDEVGELSPAFQVKLLRVLETKLIEPVGAEESVSADVRIISATNRNLKEMVSKGTFRDDLYYRLCVVPIHLPPLRDRKEDLVLLVSQILDTIRKETTSPIRKISDEVMDLLAKYSWPGNIRELINVLQYASVRSSGEEVMERHIPPEVRNPVTQPPVSLDAWIEHQMPKRKKLSRTTVQQALAESNGNKVKAAKILGVGRATLYRFLNNPSDR